jgi:sec-independent protein translocase protein TatA
MELGSGEILLILIVALLVYGGRLPEVARAVGKSVGELKRGLTATRDVVAKELDPGVSVELDEPPRETWRAPPAPEALAKEDISKPEYDPGRHEHPN